MTRALIEGLTFEEGLAFEEEGETPSPLTLNSSRCGAGRKDTPVSYHLALPMTTRCKGTL